MSAKPKSLHRPVKQGAVVYRHQYGWPRHRSGACLGGNVTYMAKATLRKELTRQMNADLEVLKDEYEHAKARAKAQGLPSPPCPRTQPMRQKLKC